MTDLRAFLAGQTGGEWNCSTMPADWCVELGHPDFASAWRATLAPVECDAAAASGLVPLWDAGIAGALPAVEVPQAGDIAVIEAMGLEVGAIFTGARWATRGARTMHYLGAEDVRVLKVWRP
ncbi:hypothetical protein CA235_07510 [Sphingomonas sp. ABOLF]|uniref:hypothetical protein n=1 Tax=Sphingomonas sp. ABOLF TaxID=1985879 RepID=UPI000F7D5D0A|nr:hypothetical protein [Sphingomonas sp. ABOLF]RSV15690.1 hypothetical protein CA235_07510 [Sphingomonas sp. ABOLF]